MVSEGGENTRTERGQFKSGNEFAFQPGNSGRPKGSRNKLGEEFLADMLADWQEHGVAAIVKVREDRPHEYIKVVASILPKELNVKVSELDELTDDQIARQLASIASQLAAAGFGIGEGVGSEAQAQPTGEVPTIQ